MEADSSLIFSGFALQYYANIAPTLRYYPVVGISLEGGG